MSEIAGPQTNSANISVSEATERARKLEEEYLRAKAEYASSPSLFATSDARRERVYAIGSDALECLVNTMQPFDTKTINFEDLQKQTSALRVQRNNLAIEQASLQQKLDSDRSHMIAFEDESYHAILCFCEMALLTVKDAVEASAEALSAARRYEEYSRTRAGNDMLDAIYAINNAISAAMIDTEPNQQALASQLRLSLSRPRSAYGTIFKTAAISQTLVTAATAQKTAISASGAKAAGGGLSKKSSRAKATSNRAGSDALAEDSEHLTLSAYNLTASTEQILDRVPTNDAASTCARLDERSSDPSLPLTLDPSGDILLSRGDRETIYVSGGTAAYTAIVLTDPDHTGVTATVHAEGDQSTIVLSASAEANLGSSYLLTVGDSRGFDRSITILISGDSIPDCRAESKAAPMEPKAGHAELRVKPKKSKATPTPAPYAS